MGPRMTVAMSLGKTVAEIAADFAPIPALSPAVAVFCAIVELCQNVVSNKNAACQLRDRCHILLSALSDLDSTALPSKIAKAASATAQCFRQIEEKMDSWAHANRFVSFTRQAEVAEEIRRCHAALSDCLTKFQLVSHLEIHEWQYEYNINAKRDHMEVLEYLSEIQNSQQITKELVGQNQQLLQTVMGMMQSFLGETTQTADRTFNGLSSNLYQLQLKSGQLLPDFNLKSGEVKRLGHFPVSGSASMDIYEGLYLQGEKVAIKVIRAVNSNQHSLRRFEREVKIWAKVWKFDRGKHVLPFYGFCQNDGPYPYMVSPWQQNGNAINYVQKNDSVVDYQHLVQGIAQGLEVLHTMSPPVVHGDLKGANVVIDVYGNPLLADFGLSQIVEDITGIPFTQSRGVSDSYRWFAPEVCVGQGVLSLASDVYSYAMTILELLTHQQPFSNIKHTTEVVIRSSRGEHPQHPSAECVVARGLDDALWALMQKCWNSDPSQRPSIVDILTNIL